MEPLSSRASCRTTNSPLEARNIWPHCKSQCHPWADTSYPLSGCLFDEQSFYSHAFVLWIVFLVTWYIPSQVLRSARMEVWYGETTSGFQGHLLGNSGVSQRFLEKHQNAFSRFWLGFGTKCVWWTAQRPQFAFSRMPSKTGESYLIMRMWDSSTAL